MAGLSDVLINIGQTYPTMLRNRSILTAEEKRRADEERYKQEERARAARDREKADSLSALGDKAATDFQQASAAEEAQTKALEYKQSGKDWLTDPAYNPNEMAGGQVLNEQNYNPDISNKRLTLERYAPYNEGAKSILNAQQAKEKANKPSGGGLSGWSKRSEDWDAISKMPDGSEKEAAKQSYLYEWAPSTGYQASPEGISQATKRAVAVETATAPIKVKTAESSAAATATARIGAESESNKTAIRGFKPIEGVKLTDESVAKVKSLSPDIETMKKLSKELITKYDKQGGVFTGDEAADYRSKVRNLQLLAKSPALYGLGVLAGPDLMLLEQTIPDPSSIKEGMSKMVFGDISIKLKNFNDLVQMRGDQFYEANGFERIKEEEKKTNPDDWNEAKAKRLEELRKKRAAGGL